MAKRDIIVIGASAGGIEALKQLVSGLPHGFPGTILIVLHIAPHTISILPQILTRAGVLEAVHPQDGEAIQPGRIYVAPPNQHLILKRGYVNLTHGPHENRHRPAIDPLFRSAALAYRARVIGIVLSGMLDDGTAGLLAVNMRGGVCICQHPEDAIHDSMPKSAIENVSIDYVVPVSEMPNLLLKLVHEVVDEPDIELAPLNIQIETDVAEGDLDYNSSLIGKPSEFACPACGGTLWEIKDERLLRYRCRVGHAYTSQALFAHQNEALEDALWAALRALQERAAMSRRMAEHARQHNQSSIASRHEEQAEETEARAAIIKQAILYREEQIQQELEKSPEG